MNALRQDTKRGYGDLLEILNAIREVCSPQEATRVLENVATLTPKITQALDVAHHFHQGQTRKGGGPYITHPICVAAIVGFCEGDEAMICSALLHDVVEDTECSIDYVREEFGTDVANLVDALTKITEIRKEELPGDVQDTRLLASALTFRKILVGAIEDPRALIVKISDRLHNILTLDALPREKQIRISKETLAVYAPIASRLGMASIKNELEDKSFYYIYPQEYQKIQAYLDKSRQALTLKLNRFAGKLEKLFIENGFSGGKFKLSTRIKRPYSIYLKMQRKGAVSMDEILDLMAVRVLVQNPLDCYRILGIVHWHFKPIISRFKDYIALPKENGYKTIHTTIFDRSSIYEVQVRTFEMHEAAEYGNSAHWKYKAGGMESDGLKWLHNFKYQGHDSRSNPKEFYDLVKNDLYREDITIFSPEGDIYTLPAGAIALDFAYMIHSELGDKAHEALINNQKAQLNQELKSGDVVKIIKGEQPTLRYAWLDQLKTSRAKNHLKLQRKNQLKEIDAKSMINILTCFFEAPIFAQEIAPKDHALFDQKLAQWGVGISLSEASKSLENLKKLIEEIREKVKEMPRPLKKKPAYREFGFLMKNLMQFRLTTKIINLSDSQIGLSKSYLDNFIIHTNPYLQIKQVLFNDCCRPKYGDEIVAILPNYRDQKIVVHTKLCKEAGIEIDLGLPMVSIRWSKRRKEIYKCLFYLGDKHGALLRILEVLHKNHCSVVGVNYSGYGDDFSSHCEIIVECNARDASALKELLTQVFKEKLVSFSSLKDAYQS
ncbi:RelA/SpoT family protein [Helicobacter felis]|uniref:Guanosine-3',5'-bis(Diphosphate) 3'-pyrophosphohydrolase n=1 Tax=Helicobacter felis (strain ATCC 49179 / CCUG 28539 / NCTC 12436 / CS1) TaxID=936155 RepID=E7A910_HELFC|nr:putative guanosine-3',5'-bis(diphosphate) 3'-pyrophosphohydrolase [Helicobacter felis ATCC 49179]